MPSSISSSDRFVPRQAWGAILGAALCVVLLFVGAMELRLAARGFRASANDSAWLWREQRERASSLGAGALVLIGGSRMQLDLDLDELRSRTGLQPVQLAIDGSSFVPVLEGLAADPAVTGTVLVDYSDQLVTAAPADDKAAEYQAEFERVRREPLPPVGNIIESRLASSLRDSLRSLADAARPVDSLRLRILDPQPELQYLAMRRDRSRAADYRRVRMPEFYITRVLRHLGESPRAWFDLDFSVIDQRLAERIAALQPMPADTFRAGLHRLRESVDRIQDRGGKVIFIVLPKSGYVKNIDDKTYPRERFWNVFTAGIGARTLHFEDHAALREFICPDGSHLDQRDRTRFTALLSQELNL